MKYVLVSSVAILFCCISTGCSFEKNKVKALAATSSPIEQVLKKSIVETLKEHDSLSVKEQMDLYRKLKLEQPDAYNFANEDEVTMYGYSFLWADETDNAIEVFKLIVEQFPESSNPYDSLGEGYMVKGDKAKAIANYKKSLELNPDNFNAEDQIERMENPDKKPLDWQERFSTVFTPEQYKSDLEKLGLKLTEVHPNALKFISRQDFWAAIEAKKSLITPATTFGEFAWYCSEIIANVNCSHTSMGRFDLEHQLLPKALKFPLQTRWVNNRLFVIDPLNNAPEVAVKDEILSINGIAVAEIIKEIYRHIPSQGYVETTKQHSFNNWSTSLIAYSLRFPEAYEVKLAAKDKTVALKAAESLKDPVFDQSVPRCKDELCFQVQEENNIAVLTVASFNYYPWNNLDVFVEFIDQSFQELKEKGIENLIIDLRFNGGGSSESSIHLLKHLAKAPFTYYSRVEFAGKEGVTANEQPQYPFAHAFDGKCYFIIDGNGNSTTGHFMSLVKVLNLGVIVGEELGSNQFCSAGQTILRLPNTKIVYYVANNTHVTTATSLPDETGILPDHFVTQTIDEYLAKTDAVMNFTLQLIKK